MKLPPLNVNMTTPSNAAAYQTSNFSGGDVYPPNREKEWFKAALVVLAAVLIYKKVL